MDEIEITITDLSRGGSGVARRESGEVVFVPFTAPGDRARVRIIDSEKNYSQGELLEVIEPSPRRVTPPCPHFRSCGGCAWQHLPYPLQFETKKKGLLHALKRAGVDLTGIPVDDLPADQPYGYRNRIQLHGNSTRRELGFFRPASKVIVDLERCEIAEPAINAALPGLRQHGFSEFKDDFKLEVDLSPDGAIRSAWNMRNAAFGFRQVNDRQNLKLRAWIRDRITPAELLIDLYGGDGNLSMGLTDRFQEIECTDLFTPRNRPADLPSHFHFSRMDISKWSERPLPETRAGMSASVIADPPREGMNRLADAILEKLRPLELRSFILVGCEVDAFTRDARRLIQRGLRLERLAVLDLFPQTPHVESLALFSS